MNVPVTSEVLTIESWFGPIRVTVGQDNPVQWRPQRKVRGRRRYYRKLAVESESVVVQRCGWFELKHWHVDRLGLGNLSWRERRSHLAALFAVYRRVLAHTQGWSDPYECWLQIDAADSSQDAVFLQTPNPSSNTFPVGFDSVLWDGDIPERLREFVTDPTWQFGRSDHWRGDLRTHFFVRGRPAP